MSPWREVVHIVVTTGRRGGEHWSLLLECGHHAARPRQRPGMPAALRRVTAGEAPRRVRCAWCGMGCKPHPETIAAEVAALNAREASAVAKKEARQLRASYLLAGGSGHPPGRWSWPPA